MIGAGDLLERVDFDMKGRSPLVAHYLNLQKVNQNRSKQKVRRTQVAKQPYPFQKHPVKIYRPSKVLDT